MLQETRMKISPNSMLLGIGVFLLTTSFLLFFVGPEFITARYSSISSTIDSGKMGDTFGGTLGPIIAWIAAILTFAAFYIQYEANKMHIIQFEKQANDTVVESFENRFFELIRLHRENVEEQNIQGIILGRKVFTTYYFELRYIYIVLEATHDNNPPSTPLKAGELTNLAYLIFFFGIGHVTTSVFDHISPRYCKEKFFVDALGRLEKEKRGYRESLRKTQQNNLAAENNVAVLPDLEITHRGKTAVFKQVYEPFTGHGTKIGHYYRHLFQTVRYVATQEHKVFTPEVKYSYVKTLRAQLSNFEQVLFYYNAVSILGQAWIENKYIQEFRLITNLPLSFADFGVLPDYTFREEIEKHDDFFDWECLKNSLS